MTVKRLQLRAGVNRENTRYSNEGGYYVSEKVRFRQGTPEKIGGWAAISGYSYQGVCRAMTTWSLLTGVKNIGVGTNLKYYVESGGNYNDVTPIRVTRTLGANPFQTFIGLTTVTVTDAAHGCLNGDFVTFNGATATGGITISGEYQITFLSVNTYSITHSIAASANSVGGGANVRAMYQINTGSDVTIPTTGWGVGSWGSGTWGLGVVNAEAIRLWTHSNFGEDLIFAPIGGPMYYWDATTGYTASSFTVTIAAPAVVTAGYSLANGTAIMLDTTGALPTGLVTGTVYYVVGSAGTTFNLSATYGGAAINTAGAQSGTHTIMVRALPVTSLGGASDVPLLANYLIVSDVSRFVIAFGTNEYGSTTFDPMVVRWSDQESAVNWTPAATNQAGDLRLSIGSKIVTALQTRQEILVWTDAALYSLQYKGPPAVWGASLLGDSISIASSRAMALASGVTYWMGIDKFYYYDGQVHTLQCDLRQYIFSDINQFYSAEFHAGTVESFNEVWWFYCSSTSTEIDRYVVYNYQEKIWYYGTMARTSWLDSGLFDYPIGAVPGSYKNLVYHEYGVDDSTTATPAAITSYIETTEFDIDDGDRFGFIYRILPDITFVGSTATNPSVTMTLIPMKNAGSGYTTPASVGGSDAATVTRTATVPIEQFTGQVYVRVRGRQLILRIESNALGVQWQLGAPRIDIRPDGRR